MHGSLYSYSNSNEDIKHITYITTDHLNTPRIGTDEQSNIVWRWDSDAFGQAQPDKDPDNDTNKRNIRLRFPGQHKDSESGLYYNWNRYYDPNTGRYITSDPIGLDGGFNTYAYVNGNSINFIDPLGLCCIMQTVVDRECVNKVKEEFKQCMKYATDGCQEACGEAGVLPYGLCLVMCTSPFTRKDMKLRVVSGGCLIY